MPEVSRHLDVFQFLEVFQSLDVFQSFRERGEGVKITWENEWNKDSDRNTRQH